jgi:hypothetical protein
MKIIYDSKQEVHKRVILLDNDGKEIAIMGCFKIEVESTKNGKGHEHLNFARWGNQKEREKIHAKVQEKINEELP